MYAQLAYKIAVNAHKGQTDKAGADYIDHPIAVANQMETDTEKAVAYLHDVVEDTDITLNQLSTYGFSLEILDAVDAITRREQEQYRDYIERVKENAIALKVKLADLRHNSDITRFQKPTSRDIARCNNYKRLIEELECI